jgi:hypothetical protein
VSAALAVPFLICAISAFYVELSYMRDGWPWMNIYPDARGEIVATLVGSLWLAVSCFGFVRSRRRGRAALLNPSHAPRPAPG